MSWYTFFKFFKFVYVMDVIVLSIVGLLDLRIISYSPELPKILYNIVACSLFVGVSGLVLVAIGAYSLAKPNVNLFHKNYLHVGTICINLALCYVSGMSLCLLLYFVLFK